VALVGDILLSAREAVPDLPGTLPAPAQSDIAYSQTQATGGFLAAGTYYVQATYTTPWGETAPGPEQVMAVTAPNNCIVASPAASPYLNMILSLVVYLGFASGAESQRYEFPVIAGQNYQVLGTGYSVATPPLRNSAFLLDSSGPVASAQQVFRWFNGALNAISLVNGGVPDVAGFGTVVGVANFKMPGDWQSLDGAWYDGYPLYLGSGKLVYRHNTITSLAGMISYTQVADSLIVELFPQPVRTAGATTLSVAMTATANVAQTAGLTGFVLPFGLAILGVPGIPGQFEIVSYTAQGGNLAGCVRGLGGTNAAAWPVGTPVGELNLYFSGFRAAQNYQVGDASNSIRIPSAWVPYIHLYVLSRYRTVEQNQSEAKELMDAFDAYLKQGTKKKAVIGERQIQPQSETMVDVFPGLSRTFGGLIIP
jgi:hypothetical protein